MSRIACTFVRARRCGDGSFVAANP